MYRADSAEVSVRFVTITDYPVTIHIQINDCFNTFIVYQ